MAQTQDSPDSVDALLRERLGSRKWRLRNLYWIKDKYGKKVRFTPNAVQEQVDDNLHCLNLILKARQHGITTWACIRALDIALFRSNTAMGMVFHKIGDAESAFRDKILFAYDNLPASLQAARPIRRRSMDGELEFENGSSIKVSLSHRSGTLQWLHISEYGKICARDPLRAQEIQSGALNTVAPGNYITIESTAEGQIGDFHAKCKAAMALQKRIAAGVARLGEMDYKLHFLPWFLDPTYQTEPDGIAISDEMREYFDKVEAETGHVLTEKQRAWYVKKAEEQGDLMWREYPSTPDEAFRASKDGSYYGQLMGKAEVEGRILQIPARQGLVHCFWDLGRNDENVIGLMQHNGEWYDWLLCYANSGEPIHHYAQWLQRIATERGYVFGYQHLPHDANVVDYSREDRKSRAQVLEDLGFKVKVVPRIDDVGDGIEMLRQMLPRCRFDVVGCGESRAGSGQGLIQALKQYRKEWNEKGQTFRDYPLHDWTSNYADMMRQAAQGYEPEKTRQERRRNAQQGNWKTA